MDIKNLDEALKLQKDFTAKLMQGMESLRQGKAPSLETILKEKERLISSTEAELKLAAKERETALRRWDERIERRKAMLADLQVELHEIKARVAAGQPGKPGKPPKGPKK